MKVLTWNLQWAKLSWWRAEPILERLRVETADVAVLTEAQVLFARELYPYVVDAGPHPKSRQPQGSKVVVASRYPLEVVDLVGSPDLPPKNFVAVDVEVPNFATVRVIGIVIRWNEKRAYIDALPEALAALVTDRTVLAGDYNLTMTKNSRLERDLTRTLDDVGLRLQTATDWEVLAEESSLIDHIAIGRGLTASQIKVWGRYVDGEARRITDHAGASLRLTSTA